MRSNNARRGTSIAGTGMVVMIILFVTAGANGQRSPYPPVPVIKSVQFDWSTHLRLSAGSNNWPVTWAADDRQYTVWGRK